MVARCDLVGFTVAELSYAISIDVVREIIRPLPIVDVPHAPPTIIGGESLCMQIRRATSGMEICTEVHRQPGLTKFG